MQHYKVELGSSAEKAIKKLQKSHPNIKEDLQPILSSLEYNPNSGETVKGSPFPDIPLRSKKASCSDRGRGKSHGYRIFYITLSRLVGILFIFLRKEGYPNQERILKALKEFI